MRIKEVPVLLFVYGSLKQGHSNHDRLKGSRFQGRARTSNKYTLHQLHVACVAPNRFKGVRGGVEGELYLVEHTDILEWCDVLEGHPYGAYQRVKMVVKHESGIFLPADIYLYNHANECTLRNLVPSGRIEK